VLLRRPLGTRTKSEADQPERFCFVLRERGCTDPRSALLEVALSRSETGIVRDARVPGKTGASGFEEGVTVFVRRAGKGDLAQRVGRQNRRNWSHAALPNVARRLRVSLRSYARREVFYTVMRLTALVLGLTLSLVFAASAGAEFPTSVFERCANGAKDPVAAVNGTGEMLVAWQDTQEEPETCFRSVATAAVGSTSSELAPLGPITAGRLNELSEPTGAFLDGAGDGWVMGEDATPYDGKEYGWSYRSTGAWYAFRAADGRFGGPVELPGGATVEQPVVAGDQAGSTVLAWDTATGADVAWGTPTGHVSKPVHFGRNFSVTAVGVDERGRALVVGYYHDPQAPHGAKEIAVLTGHDGSFSRPRVLALRPRDTRRGRLGVLGIPVMAAGPDGQAIIAWSSSFHPEGPALGPDTMVYRRANGNFSRPVHFATDFLQERSFSEEPNAAFVDRAGRALILSASAEGLSEVKVAPGGRPASPRRILKSISDHLSISGNALGAVAILVEKGTAGGEAGERKIILGNTSGVNRPPVVIPSLPETTNREPLTIMNTQGIDMAIWTVEPEWTKTPQRNGDTIDALTIAPDAQARQIAHGEAVP
jgi:hypothetical protein